MHMGKLKWSALTQPGDKNKKKWEEGAAAKAWGGGEELQKLISADQTA